MASSDNKRVAKNAVALTIRMVLVTIVGLYTSRIFLEALGVDDYGIYGVIGGVVGMASFLNASMAGATSRFITFELGRGNNIKLRTIFSSALIIHLAIAIVVAILAETAGLWFVNNCMNFPPERMFAVNVLYQFTILSMFVSFTQVPYTAAIIAHERMSIYAYLEILSVTLKLIIVYLLLIADTDCLILYAALNLVTSIVMAAIYRLYCLRCFPECHFTSTHDRPTIVEMLKFAGFDLYRQMCAVAKNQGQPIILNMFFGVVANAGAAIALTVTGAIGGLTTTVAQAFKPQIIKQYVANNIDGMVMMMGRSLQFTLLAYSAIAIPVVLETPNILYLWLGQVPQYSCEFLRLIALTALVESMINANNTGIDSTGNIKKISFYTGTLYLFTPIFSYLLLKHGQLPATTVYVVNIIMLMFVVLLGWGFLKRQIRDFKLHLILGKLSRVWICILLTLIFTFYVVKKGNISYEGIPVSTLDLLFSIIKTSFISTVALGLFSFVISLSNQERMLVLRKLRLVK